MPSKSAIQKMNKLLGAGSINSFGRKFSRDSDRDGVPNILDCRPYNPRKQGIIHSVAAVGARTFLKGEQRERAEAFIERKRLQSEAVGEARAEERQKQRLETARYQERTAGERRRKYVAAGGFGGEMRRGFGGVAQAFRGPVIAGPRLARRKKKKAKKTRKHRKYKLIKGVRYVRLKKR